MSFASRVKLFALIATLGGPVIAYLGWEEQQTQGRLDKEGVTVPGLIEKGEERSGRKRRKTFSLEVTFTPKDQTQQRRRFTVGRSYFESHVDKASVTNPSCEVRYVPADPNLAIVVGGSSDGSAMFPVGVVAAVLGLLTSLYMFIFRRA
jgi:hypothetical protein